VTGVQTCALPICYVYSGVPQEVASTLGSAFAKGVYFNSRIRDRFPHREIVHEDEATES